MAKWFQCRGLRAADSQSSGNSAQVLRHGLQERQRCAFPLPRARLRMSAAFNRCHAQAHQPACTVTSVTHASVTQASWEEVPRSRTYDPLRHRTTRATRPVLPALAGTCLGREEGRSVVSRTLRRAWRTDDPARALLGARCQRPRAVARVPTLARVAIVDGAVTARPSARAEVRRAGSRHALALCWIRKGHVVDLATTAPGGMTTETHDRAGARCRAARRVTTAGVTPRDERPLFMALTHRNSARRILRSEARAA